MAHTPTPVQSGGWLTTEAFGGTARVENLATVPLFVRPDGLPFTLTAAGVPSAGFFGVVILPGQTADVFVPELNGARRMFALHQGGTAAGILLSRGEQAVQPSRWAFTKLAANTVTDIPLDGILGRQPGAARFAYVDGDYYATGDGTTPSSGAGSLPVVAGREWSARVTHLPSGIPTARAIATGTPVVAITA